MIETIIALVAGHGAIAGGLGGAATIASAFFGGWQKWAAIAVAFAALAFWIMGLKLTVAHRDITIASMGAAVTQATKDIDACADVNDGNLAELARIRAGAEAAIAAIAADRDRIATESKEVKVIRETIHVAAQQCVGNPAAYGSVDRWLREHPDAAAGGDHRAARGKAGDPAGAVELRR